MNDAEKLQTDVNKISRDSTQERKRFGTEGHPEKSHAAYRHRLPGQGV